MTAVQQRPSTRCVVRNPVIHGRSSTQHADAADPLQSSAPANWAYKKVVADLEMSRDAGVIETGKREADVGLAL